MLTIKIKNEQVFESFKKAIKLLSKVVCKVNARI
jgi:hypothetical protein